MSMDTTEETVLQANRSHFDRMAHHGEGGYDENPFVQDVASQIADVIRKEYTFNEDSTVMLDFACGTGALVPLI
jgi:2-polyprenyl-3-methyl-5-hydroxy-6-metoxy-1,4-benzoquinol methylase